MDAKTRYRQLFPTDHEKAEAFDQIAECFYFGNFGSVPKADIDLLLFSIYLNRIQTQDTDYMEASSDYTLSKLLAVPQSRISALKVRKNLKYPNDAIDWQAVLQKCVENARYEGGKIRIMLPDKTIYLEVKHAIEMAGGFVEVTLTPNLLQVDPGPFVDLMLQIRGKDDRDLILKEIRDQYRKQGDDAEFIEQQPFSQILKESGIEYTGEVISDLLRIPFLKKPIQELVERLVRFIANREKNSR